MTEWTTVILTMIPQMNVNLVRKSDITNYLKIGK